MNVKSITRVKRPVYNFFLLLSSDQEARCIKIKHTARPTSIYLPTRTLRVYRDPLLIEKPSFLIATYFVTGVGLINTPDKTLFYFLALIRSGVTEH